MKSPSWKQVTGWAGVVYVVLFVALGMMIFDGPGSPIPRPISANGSGTTRQRRPLHLGYAVGIRGPVPPVRVRVASFLAPADARNEGVWSRLSFAGAVAQAATGFVALSFWGVLAQEDILAVVSDEVLQTLNAFDTMIFFAIMSWPQAIFLLGASVVIIQSGVLPKWIGWLGLAIALLGVISALWTFSGDNEGILGDGVGTLSFLGIQFWVLVVAITMIRWRDVAE